jgi:zinc transport system substrate-binding protein
MNFKKTYLHFILTLTLLICSTGISAATVAKPIVGVSIVPQATFVQAVAGNFADVVTMIPPGNSPGNYAPTPLEIQKLSKASLYFTIGVPTEQANILPKGKELNPTMKVVNLAAEVEKVYAPRYFSPGKRDPHLWLSPKRVKTMVEVIAKELTAIDPKHQTEYNKNAQAYIRKLNKLDQTIKDTLSGISKKNFIVYHPAFGYFADDYGLSMLALEESGKESSAKNFQELVDVAKREHIKVVFYQKEFDNKQAQALAIEIGGKVQEFAPLAPNYIKNLEKMAKLLAVVLK